MAQAVLALLVKPFVQMRVILTMVAGHQPRTQGMLTHRVLQPIIGVGLTQDITIAFALAAVLLIHALAHAGDFLVVCKTVVK